MSKFTEDENGDYIGEEFSFKQDTCAACDEEPETWVPASENPITLRMGLCKVHNEVYTKLVTEKAPRQNKDVWIKRALCNEGVARMLQLRADKFEKERDAMVRHNANLQKTITKVGEDYQHLFISNQEHVTKLNEAMHKADDMQADYNQLYEKCMDYKNMITSCARLIPHE